MQESKTSVLIVDEQSIIRWAVRSYLEQHGFSVAGETDSSAAAVDLVALRKPNAVLMELASDEGNAIEATRAIRRSGNAKVVAFGVPDRSGRIEAFFRAGGSGFVSKNSDVGEILTAINSALEGRRWVSPQIPSAPRAATRRRKRSVLSPREQEIAVMIAKGLSSSQISARLFVALKTIETHRYRVFRKLEIHSRAELVDYVLKHNLMADLGSSESD